MHQGTYEGDGSQVAGERQETAFVLQEYNAFVGHITGCPDMLWLVKGRFFPFRIAEAVGVIEETQLKFFTEDPFYRVVDKTHRYLALLRQAGEAGDIAPAL